MTVKVEDSGVARDQKGRLDLEYLRRWSQEHDTLDLLERVLADAAS